MKYIKKFESFNEGILQKAIDFAKDPSGKKRAASAAEAAEDAAEAAAKKSSADAKKAESDKRDAEANAKEKEYRSKLSPDQLKQLEDFEDAEYRHLVMTGGGGDYGSHFHNRKNKWDK